ncbi:hypothetical protein D2T30_05800 [Sinirhodobacter populi]|uniref:Uncharacterized protein n=1 Tax=Paenirhodobacter populi TaxID=2306993 RepID=A0A443JPM1_9RHOB|nr:hypothetical protein [Sinirhodobacter populi]RWR22460.1 hypothetical protein D2T30_05800 [Sinirhodobacter populi]
MPCWLVVGQGGVRPPTGPEMPAFGTILDDARVAGMAGMADYIRSGWGNFAPAVDPGAVRKVCEELSK